MMALMACPTVRPLPVWRGIRRVVAMGVHLQNGKTACRSRPFCSLLVGLIADNRNLFHLSSNGSPLQSKDHIRCALKKALVLFPAYAAFAMLQANELLLHFSAAVRADFIAGTHGQSSSF
jgi:hypothetical protein